MKKVDLCVKSPHFYTMEGEGVGYKNGVCMIVDGGKIIDFICETKVDSEYQAAETLELKNHAILPGFIDAHMHTGETGLRGLAQDTNAWMMYGLQPFSNVLKPDDQNAGTCLGHIEAIKAGTTCLGDYYINMDFVASFVEKTGARGVLSHMMREALRKVYHPGELYEYDTEYGNFNINENLALFDKWHNKANGRIKVLFGPQGPDFGSVDFLLKVQKMAKERKTKIHMHVQQGDRETYQVVKRYGKRPIEWLDSIGYLDSDLIAVHLTDARDDEAEVVAKSGASMILCPGSIGIIDGVVPPSVAFQNAGGNCALGSDQAPGNNCHNIINEMKNVALFNKIKFGNPEVMPAWRALRMATIEGAKALGMGDLIGSLEIGKQADFIAIDLSCPSMMPVFTTPMRNIVPNLVYSARGNEVTHAFVDGKAILKDRRLTNVNEDEYFGDVQARTVRIGAAATKEFDEINGTNAQFMRENKL